MSAETIRPIGRGEQTVITMKEVNLTKEVLEEIRKTDLEFYPHIGPIDWYLARYKPWPFGVGKTADKKRDGSQRFLDVPGER